jgi:hypothetical protein
MTLLVALPLVHWRVKKVGGAGGRPQEALRSGFVRLGV